MMLFVVVVVVVAVVVRTNSSSWPLASTSALPSVTSFDYERLTSRLQSMNHVRFRCMRPNAEIGLRQKPEQVRKWPLMD